METESTPECSEIKSRERPSQWLNMYNEPLGKRKGILSSERVVATMATCPKNDRYIFRFGLCNMFQDKETKIYKPGRNRVSLNLTESKHLTNVEFNNGPVVKMDNYTWSNLTVEFIKSKNKVSVIKDGRSVDLTMDQWKQLKELGEFFGWLEAVKADIASAEDKDSNLKSWATRIYRCVELAAPAKVAEAPGTFQNDLVNRYADLCEIVGIPEAVAFDIYNRRSSPEIKEYEDILCEEEQAMITHILRYLNHRKEK